MKSIIAMISLILIASVGIILLQDTAEISNSEVINESINYTIKSVEKLTDSTEQIVTIQSNLPKKL